MAALMGGIGATLLKLTRPLQPVMPRMLPSLVIIGAQKAGTTTLFDILVQHPQVIAPRKKEISYFSKDEEYAKGIERYWKEFPRYPRTLGRFITLDASPMYLYHEQAPERIAKHLPDALCLAILRDPVSRAYSAWNMYRSFKDHPVHGRLYDPRSFEQAVEEEMAEKFDRPGRRYLERSEYAVQLERFLSFMPSQRLIIWEFPVLADTPERAVNDLCARLRIERFPAGHEALGTKSNSRTYVHSMDPALKERLDRYFDPDRRRLEELVKRRGLQIWTV